MISPSGKRNEDYGQDISSYTASVPGEDLSWEHLAAHTLRTWENECYTPEGWWKGTVRYITVFVTTVNFDI